MFLAALHLISLLGSSVQVNKMVEALVAGMMTHAAAIIAPRCAIVVSP